MTAAAEKILNTLREPVRVADRWLDLTVSIGIAIASPGAKETAAALLARADAAMYVAKRAGRNCFRLGGEPGREGTLRTGADSPLSPQG